MKQMLSKIKIHIPTKTLERGIVMPRDFDNYRPAYPQGHSQLIVDPWKEKRDEKKKKKRKGDDIDIAKVRAKFI